MKKKTLMEKYWTFRYKHRHKFRHPYVPLSFAAIFLYGYEKFRKRHKREIKKSPRRPRLD